MSDEPVKLNEDHYYIRSHDEFDVVKKLVGKYYSDQSFVYRLHMDNEGPKFPCITKIHRKWNDVGRRWDIEFTFGDPKIYARNLSNEIKTLIELNPVIGVDVYEIIIQGKQA